MARVQHSILPKPPRRINITSKIRKDYNARLALRQMALELEGLRTKAAEFILIHIGRTSETYRAE